MANADNLAASYTDTPSPTSMLTSAYEEAECVQLNAGDNYQVSSRVRSYPGTPQLESIHTGQHLDDGLSSSYGLLQSLGTQAIPPAPREYMSFFHRHGGADSGGGSFASGSQRTLDLASWEEVWGHSTKGEIAGEHQPWNS